jgi:hypothetical protein
VLKFSDAPRIVAPSCSSSSRTGVIAPQQTRRSYPPLNTDMDIAFMAQLHRQMVASIAFLGQTFVSMRHPPGNTRNGSNFALHTPHFRR